MKSAESGMRAVTIHNGTIHVVTDHPVPHRPAGWLTLRVLQAGICGTDLQIRKGYQDFEGIPGHEFVGRIEEADNPELPGRRVVGEINVGCGSCRFCRNGLGRHCLQRKVLGLNGLDGCMADYCVLPQQNVISVPDWLTDDQAVLTEPLAAACEIFEQIKFGGNETVAVLGDGRLGILCAWTLSTRMQSVTLLGKHDSKLKIGAWNEIQTCRENCLASGTEFDVVVEATGSEGGIMTAMELCRARGTIVLKSTLAESAHLNLSQAVVREQTIIGSRCGRLRDALALLNVHRDMPLSRLISHHFALEQASRAFAVAEEPESLKIILTLTS